MILYVTPLITIGIVALTVAVRLAVAVRVVSNPPMFAFPVTAREVRVPTEVMLGCAAVVNEPPKVVEVSPPLTASDARVPTEVIFG